MSPHTRGRKNLEAVRRERDAVLAILAEAATRLTRSEIMDAYERRFGDPIAYNTIKARLDDLIEAGAVMASSRRRPATYTVVLPPRGQKPPVTDLTGDATRPDPAAAGSADENGIRLSKEANRVRDLVHRPRSDRQPVGYDMTFLDRYEPGKTWYIDVAERARLRELGRTTYMGQPAGTYARDIMGRLVIDLSWGSSRLEGLKYSRIDTAELLDEGRTPSGASPQDRQLILNHKAAIEFLVEEAGAIAFNRYTLLNLHALLAENLLEKREDEGALRTRAVLVGTSVYTPPEIPQVIEERFGTLLEKAEAIPDAIEQAFFAMVHIPCLQPFIDVNKRTSRLASNISLIRENLCPLSFVDVPEGVYTDGILGVYEQTDVSLLRDVFVWAYERSCAQFNVLRVAMGEPNPIRLDYRTELRELVRDAVRQMQRPTDDALRVRARELSVPEADRDAFVVEARKDLQSLRPDILARFGLRVSEYERWAKG